MTKSLIAALLTLPAGLAIALDPPATICEGQLIVVAVDKMKDARFRLVTTRHQQCGGGTDEYGNKISRGPCLAQVWRSPRREELYLFYGHGPLKNASDPDWRLIGVDDGTGRIFLPSCPLGLAPP